MAPLCIGQIEVIDAAPEVVYRKSGKPVAAPSVPQGGANSNSEVFYQMQLLQEEVLQLRGLVEQQQHEIQRLKQQRMDDYINLDKRISALGGAPAARPAVSSGPPSHATSTIAPATRPAPHVAGVGEEEAYKNAYAQVRARNFKEATDGFLHYLERYPSGKMAPNAQYWLGELYLLEGKLDEAKARFELLPNQYPQHRKVPDAMFKLAKLYDIQGESAASTALLKKVVAQYGNSSAAAKAKKYLQDNP